MAITLSIFASLFVVLSSPPAVAGPKWWPWWPNSRASTGDCDLTLGRRAQGILDRVVVDSGRENVPRTENSYSIGGSAFVSESSGHVGFIVWPSSQNGTNHKNHDETESTAKKIERLRIGSTQGVQQSQRLETYPYIAWNHGVTFDVFEFSSGECLISVSQSMSLKRDLQIVGRLTPALDEAGVFDGINYRVYREKDRLRLVFAIGPDGDALSLPELVDLESRRVQRVVPSI